MTLLAKSSSISKFEKHFDGRFTPSSSNIAQVSNKQPGKKRRRCFSRRRRTMWAATYFLEIPMIPSTAILLSITRFEVVKVSTQRKLFEKEAFWYYLYIAHTVR